VRTGPKVVGDCQSGLRILQARSIGICVVRKSLKKARRWRNRAAGSERRDGQVAALQAGLYGVGDPPQASISSLWRTAVKYYVGLDVAMKETAICIVDEQRRVVREGRVASEPEAIAAFLVAIGLSASCRGLCEGGRPLLAGGAGRSRPLG
jgi:hypothetical protein